FEKALAEADLVDAKMRAGAAGPLAGAPFLVKDLDAMGGEPLTYGSKLFRDFTARSDEPLIGAARAAGMVAIGKSNTPEFGLISTTEPVLHGPTRNPWDLSLSPGGSSGGAAAAVAAGVTPIAHASDGGGSIRIPAAACGLFGLKPSYGRGLKLSRPSPGNISVGLCVSRSVRDTARFLEISDRARAVAETDAAAPGPIGYVSEPLDRPLRIALAPDPINGGAPEPSVAAALQEAAALCADLGHHVEEAAPKIDGPAATEHFLALWASVAANLKRSYLVVRAYACGLKPWKWPRYEDAFDPWTRGLAEKFRAAERARPGQIKRSLAFIDGMRADYEAFFQRYDVILSPVLRRESVPLGEQAPSVPFDTLMERVVDNVGYTPIYNALGWPAMSVPLGWSPAGLPIGVQFAAPRFEEARLL
ncbi:MAG: amidase family protein, partial [Pseudomonadota bacterium]